MGGIKSHRKGIQITFRWNGKRYRPTLDIPPTGTNLKYASRLKGEVERQISLGIYTFDKYLQDFPTTNVTKSSSKITLMLPLRMCQQTGLSP